MKFHCDAAAMRGSLPAQLLVALTLTAACTAPRVLAQSADATPAEAKPGPEAYQTIYLTNLTQQNEFNDVQTDLRNMLPKVHMYGMLSQNAISIRATPEDMQIAQKIISDLDRGKRIYRLTYTINESDSGKRTGTQTFMMIVASGSKATFKQGARVPIVTGSYDTSKTPTGPEIQVQYLDVGLNIEASADGYMDGLRLRSKIEQSNVADEKSGIGAQDPIVRQTVLDGTATLAPGKPLILGALDIPGTTRKQEIEVVAELVK